MSSRFGPPPAFSSRVGTPPGLGIIPYQGAMGTTTNVGTPPLSIASDTRRSSHHRPHQCRTLARSQAPRTQSPVHSSARGVTQLHIKGVLPLSFPQENVSHHPAHGNPCDQGNNALNQDFERLDDGDADGRGCLLLPLFCLSVGVCL